MRIAVVDLLFNWPPDGGARVDVKEVAERLARHHQVRLFVPDHPLHFPRGRIEGEMACEIERVPFNRFTFNLVQVPARFRAALERYRPDAVFVTDGWYLKPWLVRGLLEYKPLVRFYAYEGLCLNCCGTFQRRGYSCSLNYLEESYRTTVTCNRCALGYIKHSRDRKFAYEYVFGGVFLPAYADVVKQALRGAGRCIVYNRFLAAMLSIYQPNISIIPSGVDPAPFLDIRPPDNDVPVIGMAGRISTPTKGYWVLKDACDLLVERGYKFKLHITVDHRKSFQKQPYVENFVWMPPERLPEFYRPFDIAVVPSVWQEPFGIVALEGMAAGKPVVASRVGGLQHTVVDGETGLLFPPRDYHALADCLARLLDSPAERRAMGEAGRQRVLEQYTWDGIVERHYLPLFASPQAGG